MRRPLILIIVIALATVTDAMKCELYTLYDNEVYECNHANNVELQQWGYEYSCLYVWKDGKSEYSCCGVGDPGAGERKYSDQTYCEYRSDALDPVLHTYTYLINGTGESVGERDVLVCCNDNQAMSIILIILICIVGVAGLMLIILFLIAGLSWMYPIVRSRWKSMKTPGCTYSEL